MIKFKLKYGIELSVDSVSPEEFKPIEWLFPFDELEFFKDGIDEKINSMIGAYGHGISTSSIMCLDFISAIKSLTEWEPELIQGAEFENMLIPVLELPDGAVS